MPSRHERYRTRLTVDLDGKEYGREFGLRAVRTWHNLRDLAADVDVHVSTGQGGLHFVAWFREDLPFHEQVQIRRAVGDDPRRIDMDEQRWLQVGTEFTDVLFNQKGDRDQIKERRFRDVYDALDYIHQREDDSERVRRLALDGHKGAPGLARSYSQAGGGDGGE